MEDLSRRVPFVPRLIVGDASMMRCHLPSELGEVRQGDVVVLEATGDSYQILGHLTTDTWRQLLIGPLVTQVHERALTGPVRIVITPMPTDGVVTLSVPEPRRLSIYSLLGALLWRSEVSRATIDISRWAQGMYVVTDGLGSVTQLIKQ